ncbi:hypothetical protein ACWDKQ_05600 [Saccharopolyspora sp. NPDC000995]
MTFAAFAFFLSEKSGALAMQSNSRTFVSVVGTVLMVVTTVALSTWNPPQSETSVQPAANQMLITSVNR